MDKKLGMTKKHHVLSKNGEEIPMVSFQNPR